MMQSPLTVPRAILAVALSFGAAFATAQEVFPSRPIRIVVPFEPGGSTDTLARLAGPRLAEELGQPVVYENRAGAGSVIGNTLVAKAPADGYTLLVGTSAMSLNYGFANKGVIPKIPFDTLKDFEGVALLGITPYLLLTSTQKHYATVSDLVQQAKTRSEAVSFASAGSGGSPHLGGVLFGARTGTSLLHVPFKGSAPAMMALAQGQVDFTYASLAAAKPHLDAGRLRALAVAAPQRVAFLPGVPTLSESGVKNADVDSWFGLLAPAGTPKDRRERLARAVNAAMGDPAIVQRLAQMGAERTSMGLDAFDAFVKRDMQQWDQFIRGFKGSLQ